MIPDGTLGGYFEKHSRPPAFEGSDGNTYSVDVYLTQDGESPASVQGSLLFVSWSADGSQPVGHVETDVLCSGLRKADVESELLSLSFYDVKDHLDQAIERTEAIPDW